jgi:hypothetical protein
MIYPSSIHKNEGDSFDIEEIERGMFSVQNAYQGKYEYFRGRPVADVQGIEHLDSIQDYVPNLDSETEEQHPAG